MAVMCGAACTQSKYTNTAFIARSHYYYSLRTFVSAAEWFEAGQRGEGIKEDACVVWQCSRICMYHEYTTYN